MHHKMKTIRSQNHQIRSYEINKVSLSSYDDKRYILIADGIHTYAYGHFSIKGPLLLFQMRKERFSNGNFNYKRKKIFFFYNRNFFKFTFTFLLLNLGVKFLLLKFYF